MGEQPFAVAAWIVASGILYYILPSTTVVPPSPTVAHETWFAPTGTCEDELRQIIDLGKLVDWYRWIVVCLIGALTLALLGLCALALTCGSCALTARQVTSRSTRGSPTKGKDDVLALLAASEFRR